MAEGHQVNAGARVNDIGPMTADLLDIAGQKAGGLVNGGVRVRFSAR